MHSHEHEEGLHQGLFERTSADRRVTASTNSPARAPSLAAKAILTSHISCMVKSKWRAYHDNEAIVEVGDGGSKR